MIVIALAVAAASAPTLWQNVTVGMSRAQVSQAQPKAEPSAEPSHLGDGATCDLMIAKVEVANSDYGVCFFFKSGKLTQVMLTSVREPDELQFRSVLTSLRAKYGAEINLEKTSLGYDVDWITKEKVNVSVVFMNKYGSLMNINYQYRIAKDLESL